MTKTILWRRIFYKYPVFLLNCFKFIFEIFINSDIINNMFLEIPSEWKDLAFLDKHLYVSWHQSLGIYSMCASIYFLVTFAPQFFIVSLNGRFKTQNQGLLQGFNRAIQCLTKACVWDRLTATFSSANCWRQWEPRYVRETRKK